MKRKNALGSDEIPTENILEVFLMNVSLHTYHEKISSDCNISEEHETV